MVSRRVVETTISSPVGQGFGNFIYLFIYLLKAHSPGTPHRVTSGRFTKSNLAEVENNTKHARFTNVKHKHNPKVSPFGTALIKNGK